jgi:tricarballylate dehydrogenase
VAAAGFNIVVIGHGAAGLSAAVSAAEHARNRQLDVTITLLECAPKGSHGGNTSWSPSYMRLAAADSVAPHFEEDMALATGSRADQGYFRRLAADAIGAIAWLQGHGIAFDCPIYYLSAGPPRIQPRGGGAAIVQQLGRAAEAAGVRLLYGCSAEGLAVTPDGAVAAVVARTARGPVESIPADAVVLACGGFQGNPDMLRTHFGPDAAGMQPISPGTSFNTGAGIRMALEVGARTSGDWNGMHAEPIDPRSSHSAPVVLVYPYGIVVDRDGHRVFDEGAGLVHETWETFARTIHFTLPGRIAFAILDSHLLSIAGYERAIRSEVPPVQAPSIEALAGEIGIDPVQLKKTVDLYNAAAVDPPDRFDATRLDGLRTRPGLDPPKSNWARALSRPPFLAYPLVGAIAYTFGGIATNEAAEVLGRDGPIAGLYAAGDITGHFYGTAPNAISVLRALVFGRIAGAGAVARAARPQAAQA